MADKQQVYTVTVKVIGDKELRALQAQVRGLDTVTKRLGKGSTAVKSSGNAFKSMGYQVQNASTQLGDWIVQVTNGQDAMRAFGQQAPQLLGAFGAVGAVVGVVASLMPVIIDAFINLGDSAEETAEKMETIAAAFSELRAESRTDFFDSVVEQFGEFNDQTASAKREFEEFTQAMLNRDMQEAVRSLNNNFSELVLVLAGTDKTAADIERIQAALRGGSGDLARAAAAQELVEAIKESTNGYQDLNEAQLAVINSLFEINQISLQNNAAQSALGDQRVSQYEQETMALQTQLQMIKETGDIKAAQLFIENQRFELQLREQGLSGEALDRARERRKLEQEIAASTADQERIAQANADAMGSFAVAMKSIGTSAGQAQERFNELNDDLEVFGHLLSPEQLARVNEAMTRLATDADLLGKTWKTSLTDGLDAAFKNIISGSKSASEAFGDMAKNILADIAQMIVRMQIIGPLMQSLGLGNPYVQPTAALGGLVGGVKSPMDAFATGGIISNLGSYRGALVGESGPEAIMPLRRTPSGRLGVESAGGNTTVNVINNTNADASVTETETPGGGRQIDVVIENVVQRGFARGAFDTTLRGAYGLQRRGQGGR